MADRAPGRATGTGNGAAPPAFPPAKSQMYARPAYRPRPPPPRKRGRGCCCTCCLWLTFLLIALVFLAAIAGAVFYFIYRPHRPSFAVDSLRLSTFNVSASNRLSSRLELNLTAHNPNKKLAYLYEPVTVSASSAGVSLGSGVVPGFTHDAGNTTLLRVSVASVAQDLDPSAAADLRKRTDLPLEIKIDGKAGVKVGAIKTKKIGVRVRCSGASVAVPRKGAGGSTASAGGASCEVKLRVKIWKWYL